MRTIKETFRLASSTADILAAPSRLAAIPRNGIMTIEASITDADFTNYGSLTLQLPDGDIPFEDLVIPIGVATADFSMHTDYEMLFQFTVGQGGHVLLAYTETGTVTMAGLICTLQF